MVDDEDLVRTYARTVRRATPYAIGEKAGFRITLTVEQVVVGVASIVGLGLLLGAANAVLPGSWPVGTLSVFGGIALGVGYRFAAEAIPGSPWLKAMGWALRLRDFAENLWAKHRRVDAPRGTTHHTTIEEDYEP